jgi:hypothetical protein
VQALLARKELTRPNMRPAKTRHDHQECDDGPGKNKPAKPKGEAQERSSDGAPAGATQRDWQRAPASDMPT